MLTDCVLQCSKPPSPRPLSSVRYFIMKSSNLRNIELSQQRGIWSTTPSNELKLNRAFQESSLVFLVFSVQGSGHFQVHGDEVGHKGGNKGWIHKGRKSQIKRNGNSLDEGMTYAKIGLYKQKQFNGSNTECCREVSVHTMSHVPVEKKSKRLHTVARP